MHEEYWIEQMRKCYNMNFMKVDPAYDALSQISKWLDVVQQAYLSSRIDKLHLKSTVAVHWSIY